MRHYAIIGAGISGCTAAEALASHGHEVELIESADRLGGSVLNYTCKATDECSRCGVCVAHTQLAKALTHPRIHLSLGASISSASSHDGTVAISFRHNNPTIVYQSCIGCDQCVHACPEHCITKIHRGEVIQYVIDYANCLLHKGQSCTICSEACPTNAILAESATSERSVTSDGILIATGHEPYDATQRVRLGYGRLDNVMTGVEAEEILRRQTHLRHPSDSIAFIQCVGSRDPRIGRNYCSSVCCAYALRLAQIIKYRNAETPVTIYYIDLQNFDKNFTAFKKTLEARGVQLIRGVPFAVEASRNGRVKLSIEQMDGEESIVEHDLVVLSVGMGPCSNAESLASLFGLRQDEFGFFSSSELQVFVSGTCQEPLSISDSMARARAVAFEMGSFGG
ncbi:FAD-dependent oxidoreductase [candidate division KSB3 bacterium]|uniref:FAD-dependent oxidoreductase n=1 Tax=candidate division KSB3 bacterium TaxID=2044937 RepID=A0A9D5JZI9_9BACT|nr:FAD-dependent oxidoreductase [candidate division KSB3 bacterium]MBD3326856.1 FAD-dependent oxidoreductase [candidate division KSB3 bacterium]